MKCIRVLAVLCVAALLCAPAFAQNLTSNITARAQDSTGAVIPGVEVSVSSPAMIGGARSEVTDETGAYRFTLLPPGTYRVTFALPGFKTLNIDGVNLTAGNTATQVGVMEVATTAEEITVSSSSPTIDLESATVGVNISQKMMDDLPWSRSLTGMSMMIPGVFSTSFDIGNSNFGTSSTIAARSGGRSGGNVVTIDGLVWCQTYSDYGSFEEMNVSTNAKGADQMNSGITVGMVVKSGGNQFHGNLSANYQNGSMQSTNITNALITQGYGVGSNKYTHYDDLYGDIGGPIMKDKFWFYFSYRQGYQGTFIPGFRTAVGGDLTEFYTKLRGPSAKLTYQLSSKQKLEAYMGYPDKYQPFRGGGALEPREATQDQDSWSSQGPMLTYTNIIDSKTTLTAKVTRGGYWWPAYTYGFNGDAAGLGPNIAQLVNGSLTTARIPTYKWTGVDNVGAHISDTTNGATDGAYASNYDRPIRWQESADLSRFASIGGKNNELKVGYLGWWDKDHTIQFGYPNFQAYTYKAATADVCPNSEICSNWFKNPYRVTFYNYPSQAADGAKYRSAYVNDKVTWNRKLTFNVGLRWDWATSFLPPQFNTGEGPFSQPFTVAKSQNYITNPAYDGKGYALSNITGAGDKATFPVYNLFSPRLSFAYDVFGNGKLAIKGSFGRYVGITSSPNAQPGPGENSSGVNPNAAFSCQYNNWDGSFPANKANYFGPDGIMGTSDDVGLVSSCAKTAFVGGQVIPISTYHFDSSLAPSYVNEYTAGVEYGISKNYSVRFSTQRKFDRNHSITNPALLPYSAYTAQKCGVDPGPDGRSGTSDDGTVCYTAVPNSNPAFSVTNNLYKNNDESTHEGDNSYTGYTFTFNRNYAQRWQMVASYEADLAHSNTDNPLNPNQVFSNSISSKGATVWSNSLKMSGIYGLPDIPFFHGFKVLNGIQYSSTFLTQTSSWYGRSVDITDANGSKQTVTMQSHVGRYPRLSDWDNSLSKTFRFGDKQSVQVSWQLFNSLNAATITSWKSTDVSSSSYLQPDGVTPLRPSGILSPRIYEWGIKYKF